jgi:hypothetical protein
MLQPLLDAGARVNEEGGKFGTAVQLASCHGFSSGMKLLLEAGADVNFDDGWYGSALEAASWAPKY